MSIPDFFNADAFSTTELTLAINELEYVPGQLGQLGLFNKRPIKSKNFFTERKERANALLPLTPRLAPLYQNQTSDRRVNSLEVPKIGTQETVNAIELAGVRAFGTETTLASVQREVMEKLQEQRDDMEFTKEYMRLAAVQGLHLDPGNGSTVYNYYTEYGYTPEATIDFELDDDTTNVLEKCHNIVIDVVRKSKGGWVNGTTGLYALCGKSFWHALTNHPNVKEYYVNWAAAAQLRGLDPLTDGFEFGGITFRYYMGSEDETSIAIADGEVKMFPINGRSVFSHVMAPADEFIPFVNTPGKETYVLRRDDHEYTSAPRFIGYDVVSYPLFVCERPYMLRSGIQY